MINLKKHDIVADAVLEVLQQEALKGNQHKIDANHNGKIDGEDFKILRGKKKVEEELKGNQKKIDKNHNGKIDGQDFKILRGEKKVEEEIDMNDRTKDTLVGREKTKQKDDVGPNSNAKVSKFKLKSEEAEQIDELSKDAESLEEKNWIAGAIKKPGAETAAAKKAGMSVQAYAEKHKHDSGKAGKRARLALTLKHMKERMEEPILDELINEVMSKDASAGDYIHDFIHSDNPKFAGKSKAKRKEMALAAYYSKKNEEAVNEGLKDLAKKSFKALTGGSDKDHLDRLKKDMYGDSEVKYAAKTLVKHAKDPLGLKKEEVVAEGAGYTVDDEIQHWKDMALHWARMGDEKSMLKSKANSKAAEQKKKDTGAADKQQGVAKFKHKHMEEQAVAEGSDDNDKGIAHTRGSLVAKLEALPKGSDDFEWNRIQAVHHLKQGNMLRAKYYKALMKRGQQGVAEGWDDMVKDAKEKVKSGPQPNGGSGKKQGSAYGGSKQKDKPEQEVKEAKDPTMDAGCGSAPNFATDATKPMQAAQTMAKKSLARMRSDMMAKSGK